MHLFANIECSSLRATTAEWVIDLCLTDLRKHFQHPNQSSFWERKLHDLQHSVWFMMETSQVIELWACVLIATCWCWSNMFFWVFLKVHLHGTHHSSPTWLSQFPTDNTVHRPEQVEHAMEPRHIMMIFKLQLLPAIFGGMTNVWTLC